MEEEAKVPSSMGGDEGEPLSLATVKGDKKRAERRRSSNMLRIIGSNLGR